jgi:hypothetical protein
MNNILDYLYVYNCNNKIRLGNKYDGGYVIADNIGDYDVYISAGIGEDESFSNNFLNKYNVVNSGAFQYEISKLPHNFPKHKLNFYKRNISDKSDDKNANLRFFINNYNDIFLKMDIEGSEFLWFNSLSINDLKKFKQLVVEFHGITDNSFGHLFETKMNVFKNLFETHYIIHIHGNNFSVPKVVDVNGINVPWIVEITYVRKDIISEPKLNTTILPIQNLDYPCNSNDIDINLNFKPFVN